MPDRLRPTAVSATLRGAGAAVLGACLAAAALAAGPELVHIEVMVDGAERSRTIDMEFHEIERTPEVSRARVLTSTGISAPAAALFVLRGFCTVADGRGARFFFIRPLPSGESGDAIRTAEFADERIAVTPARLPGAAPAAGTASGVYSIDDCRLAGFVR